ncbi:dicer-like protein 4 isoform X2 [Ricinus communis]|uniref:dicer-like protein 4 isoform X2 n=1 Tax=Ricinus communis TaxID=3988 RepID=UPI00201ADE53|nr:dicer-like protein 4 isoform X2 [Ricinus communis]
MPDGEADISPDDSSSICTVNRIAGDDDGDECNSMPQQPEKDPRKIARKYQLELCKKALEENIIVYLGTGCGKTHIAVLLIYELGHLIRKPLKNVCVFLAPTVALVQQQARVIEQSIDFKVGVYCGNSNHLKSHRDWEKEIEQNEVLVMTPQILLHTLGHSFIKMELISLLIFDECHHAQVQSSHPYAEIMKVFYKTGDGKFPRIFGMTASPVVGKGASNQANLPKSINSLENLLDAKVYSVEDNEELELFVASPVVRIYLYAPVANEKSSSYMTYFSKLEEIKRKCLLELHKKADSCQSLHGLQNAKKVFIRMHDNVVFCLENLGFWGALQACKILLSDDHFEWNALIEAEGNIDASVCDKYLAQAANMFASVCTKDCIAFDLSSVEVLTEPFFSRKLLRLIGILSTFRLQPNMKGIVFVNRIVTARSLSYVLQNLKFLISWKCDFLVGVHSGLKSMSRKTMNSILEKFKTGKLNLLIATKVGEEGLDIQTCCLVVRFDLPETVASFIQSRGRARMPQSEYAFLVDSGNQKELDLIERFRRDEDRMNMEISSRTSNETFVSIEEKVYKVDESGACISSAYSISLLHHYCSKLPHDEYFDPKPQFFFFDDLGGTICHIILPANAPVHQIVGTPQSSREAAKKDACLKAIEQLHKLGSLSNFLLPHEKDVNEESMLASSEPENNEGEGVRGELHEMLVPAVFKESLTSSENWINLHSYFIKFCPVPEDRIYKKFGLFIRAPLPLEAEQMELNLHLACGRYVTTKLVPLGCLAFHRDEITQAIYFQEMFLKVILDRSDFVPEFVTLGKNSFFESSPSFYLLLPVLLCDHGNRVTVDWETVGRCLSSPVFRCVEKECLPSDDCLQLANGCRSIRDIENSLVYIPHKKHFYFITNIDRGKNARSPHKCSSTSSYMEFLIQRFGIQLKYPEQPLLQAKPLFSLHNLLHNRRKEDSVTQELDEYLIDFPPELCELKIIGFSKDIGSSISLLPSIMHRLENLLVAIELKSLLSASFSEGAEVTAYRILEALTTERCQERLSLERLEILGDAFLKFAVGRHLFLLHDTLDEGELTRKRSNAVNNSNLLKLASRRNLQGQNSGRKIGSARMIDGHYHFEVEVSKDEKPHGLSSVYIRDQPFDPRQFFALGHPCPVICTKESEGSIHSSNRSNAKGQENTIEVRCSRGHHWLYKKTIADVVEALVGAFIVDSGFRAATAFLKWLGIRVNIEASDVTKVCLASRTFMPLAPSIDVSSLEDSLDHQFVNRGLVLQAFVHPSYNKHGGGCYQRLEFLGDAVLDYLITSYLFSVYPKLKPGLLTDLRSALVNNRAFAIVAVDRSFNEFLICDSGNLSEAIETYVNFVKRPAVEKDSLEGPKCPKVLGDLVESCIGAIFLDTGFDLNCIWKLMLSFLDPILNSSNVLLNPFRELHEFCESHKWKLQFPTLKRDMNFLVEAKVTGKDICLDASANNSNKKEAIRIASEQIIVKLKDQGYIRKSNYLEEVLRSGQKTDAKLIGYDETPIDITAHDPIGLQNLKIQDPSCSDFNPKIRSMSKLTNTCSPCFIAANIQPPSPSVMVGGQPSATVAYPTSDMDKPTSDGSHYGSAKSRLHDICAANCWKPPLFECCYEEGPSHLKSFSYKVIVEIEAAPDMILECFGAPREKKKAAAEHAAEGALWYLQHVGYLTVK